jgi:hypothetical protein
MPWRRAEQLAHVFDRWTRLAELIDESDGSDESLLTAELQTAVEAARSLRHVRPARAVFSGANEIGQPDIKGSGEGAEPIE